MKRLYILSLVFAVLFALFILLPPFLSTPFGRFPLMKNADVLDLFTPLVLMPFYWLLFEVKSDSLPGRREVLIFMAFAALWVLGQGMHLAANSIGHLVPEEPAGDLYRLTYYYDERLSHQLWHGGIILMMFLLLYRQWCYPFAGESGGPALGVTGGILYGITFFLAGIEGGTVGLGFTASILVTAFALIWGRRQFRHQPLLVFFFVACLVFILLFTGWGIYWGGWPEPSKVGLL